MDTVSGDKFMFFCKLPRLKAVNSFASLWR